MGSLDRMGWIMFGWSIVVVLGFVVAAKSPQAYLTYCTADFGIDWCRVVRHFSLGYSGSAPLASEGANAPRASRPVRRCLCLWTAPTAT